MTLSICIKAYPPTNFGRRTHWPPGGPVPVKARAFLVPTSWSSPNVSEVDMALISCQQATCRACDSAAVGVPLPCPVRCGLGFSARTLALH
jgi:hypothetical protein